MKVLKTGEKLLISLFDLFKTYGLSVLSEKDSRNNSEFEKEELILKVKAKPGSKVEKIQPNEQGELEVFIKAKPVEGAANKAIQKYIGKKFGIATSHVVLAKGDKSKVKSFKISFYFGTKTKEDYAEKIKAAFKK